MDIEEFTLKIKEQFDDVSLVITPETDFRDNDTFDSLIGMSILVMIKDVFGYQMSVDTFLKCRTPKDLYNAAHR